MRVVKGRFVFGKDKPTRKMYSMKEVAKATKKRKKKHPSALLMMEDLHEIFNANNPEEDEAEENLDTKWETACSDINLAFCTMHQGNEFKSTLTEKAFCHGGQFVLEQIKTLHTTTIIQENESSNHAYVGTNKLQTSTRSQNDDTTFIKNVMEKQ